MASHPEFGARTEAGTVTEAFSERIANKIVIVTGVSPSGIGSATVEALAAHSPALIICTGRSKAKVDAVIAEVKKAHPTIKLRFLQLELSSLKSVRSAAKEIMSAADIPQIDILINNAGVMDIPTRTLSEDGIELQFATNHVGHFLFTNLILEKLLASARQSPKGATRIVNVSSMGHSFSPIRFSDPNFNLSKEELPAEELPNYAAIAQYHMVAEGIYVPIAAYGQSKTANVLFSLALTQRLYEKYGILSFALHPGAIVTELWRHGDPAAIEALKQQTSAAWWKTREMGASTSLVAALDPALQPATATGEGIYFNDCQVSEPVPWARDPVAAGKLWEMTEKIVGEKFNQY